MRKKTQGQRKKKILTVAELKKHQAKERADEEEESKTISENGVEAGEGKGKVAA